MLLHIYIHNHLFTFTLLLRWDAHQCTTLRHRKGIIAIGISITSNQIWNSKSAAISIAAAAAFLAPNYSHQSFIGCGKFNLAGSHISALSLWLELHTWLSIPTSKLGKFASSLSNIQGQLYFDQGDRAATLRGLLLNTPSNRAASYSIIEAFCRTSRLRVQTAFYPYNSVLGTFFYRLAIHLCWVLCGYRPCWLLQGLRALLELALWSKYFQEPGPLVAGSGASANGIYTVVAMMMLNIPAISTLFVVVMG